jgi:hypothetical protein
LILLYPFSAKSNTDNFLNFDENEVEKITTAPVAAVRMMETTAHYNLARTLRDLKIREKLLTRDYRSAFRPGDFYYIDADFGSVACVGLSHDLDAETLSIMFSGFKDFCKGKDVIAFAGFDEWVPGSSIFNKELGDMENFTLFNDWKSFVDKINKQVNVEGDY